MGDHDAAVDFALEALAIDPLHADGQAVLDSANAALAGRLCDEGARLMAAADEALAEAQQRGDRDEVSVISDH